MFIGAWKVPSWMPRAFRAQLWRLLDTKKLNPMAAPALNAWRATQSLPPIDTSIFGTWLHAKGRVIGLFPSNFGPVSPDWPPHLELCGFPLYEAGQAQNDEELNRFCSEAEGRLLVWYPGSTATTQQHVMRESAIELARQGAKCLWLQSTEQKIFQHAGLNWMVRPNARLPSVLRKARLFVHHGGIGATAQGWAAGVPQIIKPSAYDQFENKWRLQSLTAAERQRTTEAKDSRELVRQIKAALQKEPAETRFDTFEYSRALDPNGAVRQAIASILRN
jgi:rhamnosyltransferase subunit B